MELSQRMQAHLGKMHNDTREDAYQAAIRQCPPIDPHLIDHLKLMFDDISKIKVTSPELGQMLLVQHGINQVLNYLQSRYDFQSAKARKEVGI